LLITAARAPQDYLIVYRSYIDRALDNVGAVLRRTAQRLRDQDNLLSPLSTLDPSQAKFVASLPEHLLMPALDGAYPEPGKKPPERIVGRGAGNHVQKPETHPGG
jgi:hypothetical protein